MKKFLVTIAIIFALFMVGIILLYYFFDFRCGNYSNTIKSELDKFNNQNKCLNNDDCRLITYYLCNSYSIHKNFNFREFYAQIGSSPKTCPIASCLDPNINYKSVCRNGICDKVTI